MVEFNSVVEEQYKTVRETLIFFFERKGCRTPADLADETIYRVIKKVAEGEEVRSFNQYCLGVARYVLKEHWKDRWTRRTGLDDLRQSDEPKTDPDDEAQQRQVLREREDQDRCLNQCKTGLPTEESEFLQLYCEAEDRHELARQLGITINALRLRVYHINQKIEKCCIACAKELQEGRN